METDIRVAQAICSLKWFLYASPRWGFWGKGETVFKDITNCQKTKNFTISAFNHHRSSSITAAITKFSKAAAVRNPGGRIRWYKAFLSKDGFINSFIYCHNWKIVFLIICHDFFLKKDFYVFHVCGCFVHKLCTPERASDSIGLPL